MKVRVLYFAVATFFVLSLVVTGCSFQGAQFGAPGRTGVKGVVAMPENNCYEVNCASPVVSEGEPASFARVILKGENGDYLETTADACGRYQVDGAQDSCYILYAQIQNGSAWVKKGIYPLTAGVVNDAGEANYYTTAQVIIYEEAKKLYPDQVKCSDIPNFVPTPQLLEAVKNALMNCRDAQQVSCVQCLARNIVRNMFGAPGGGGGVVAGGGAPGGGGGTGGGGTPEIPKGSITLHLYCDENPCSIENVPITWALVTTTDGKEFMQEGNGTNIYVLKDLDPGTYTVEISALGYKEENLTIELSGDNLNIEQEVRLKPSYQRVQLEETDYNGPTSGKIKITGVLPGGRIGDYGYYFTVQDCGSSNWSSSAFCANPNEVSSSGTCYTIQRVTVASDEINWIINNEGLLSGNSVNWAALVAIWKLLGIEVNQIEVNQQSFTTYEGNAAEITNDAIKAVQSGWRPCPNDKVGIIVENDGQDFLVTATYQGQVCPTSPPPQPM